MTTGNFESRSPLRPIGLGALLLSLCLGLPGLAASDVFNTEAGISKDAAQPLLNDGDACRRGPVPSPLTLFEAIERTLCESPKTRGAWAAVKAAAAGLGQAKSAYLPTLDGSAAAGHDRNRTEVTAAPGLNSDYSQNVNLESLQLAWVLYDFGGRSAAVKNGKQLLLAAQANQNAILQSVFAATARDYYAAQAAATKVESARRIENFSQKNFDAAGARYKSGVVPVTDQYQANTAYAQAVYERAAAEGAYRLALGTLAVDMSLSPDYALSMPPMDQSAQPDARFVHAVRDLLDEATASHPSVVAAKAQWQAALENVRVVRAEGLPKLGVAGSLDRSSQPLNATVGTLDYPSVSHSSSIGLTLQVPLFSGFNQDYKIRQAQAAADAQEQALRDAQQQVSLGVWSNYQLLQTDTENLNNTDIVLQSARQAFEAASQRYQSGVGNILELLNSQATLAAAEQQRIHAQLEWRTARLQLAASLGSLGMWAIK